MLSSMACQQALSLASESGNQNSTKVFLIRLSLLKEQSAGGHNNSK